MTMLLFFTPHSNLAAQHPVRLALAQGGAAALLAGAGRRGRQWTCLDLPPGRRRETALPLSLSNRGAGLRHQAAWRQSVTAAGERGRQAMLLNFTAARSSRSPLLLRVGGEGVRGYMRHLEETRFGERGFLPMPGEALLALAAAAPQKRLALAGVDITHLVAACVLSAQEDDPHFRLTLENVTPELIPILERVKKDRLPSLSLELDGGRRTFVVEEVEVNGQASPGMAPVRAMVRAASDTILLDSPYAEAVSLGPLASPQSAQAVVAQLLAPRPLTWDMEDFLLPQGTRLGGAPAALAQRIAAAAGGTLRPDEGGGFRVRSLHPFGPGTLPTAAATVQARCDAELMEAQVTELPGLPYGAVQVQGHTPDAATPLLEAELLSTGEALVRAYWREGGRKAFSATPWVSSGRVTPLGGREETIVERVAFTLGQGQVSHPVLRLDGPPRWCGEDGGEVAATPYGTQLFLNGRRHGVADIRYVSAADHYLVQGVTEPEALFALLLQHAGAVAVTVRSSVRAGAPLDPARLEVPLAGDQRAAILAGEAHLLRQCLPTIRVKARLPYNPAILDGAVAHLELAGASLRRRVLMTGWSLRLEGPSVIHTLEGLAWR